MTRVTKLTCVLVTACCGWYTTATRLHSTNGNLLSGHHLWLLRIPGSALQLLKVHQVLTHDNSCNSCLYYAALVAATYLSHMLVARRLPRIDACGCMDSLAWWSWTLLACHFALACFAVACHVPYVAEGVLGRFHASS